MRGLGVVGRVGLGLGHRRGRNELGHCLTAAPAEHHDVEQRVGAEAVRAVHRHARALARGVQARQHGAHRVDDDLAVGCSWGCRPSRSAPSAGSG